MNKTISLPIDIRNAFALQTRFVIVKKYDEKGVRYNDRMYWRDGLTGFISGLNGCSQYHTYDGAVATLRDEVKEKGVFQIEKIYVKE